MDKKKRMADLVRILDEASRAYYQEDRELMDNKEYDALYDELTGLEQELGIVLAKSPSERVGYEIVSQLPKEAHASPMLSLDKTKNPEDLVSWLGDREGLLSWKMDGLTVVLTYRDGVLTKALTRGNGRIGEVITNNARVFENLPRRIPFRGQLVIRGEAVIGYPDFERINSSIPDVDARYKNPRNLCSGSVRQLNNQITAERNVKLYAFSYVSASGREEGNSVEENMLWLASQGFEIVPYRRVDRNTILAAVEDFSKKVKENDFPSDGLVLIYDDISYGRSLGTTAKYPRDSIAFKWADEEAETDLLAIEWSPSRTGLINPVAIFEPVELEGTTVSRASLHNLSIMEGLELGIGDRILVYKANMIIPQISDNLTRTGRISVPGHCPACGAGTRIREENGVKTLYCDNPLCSAKKVKLFTHYVSRDAMNIDGLSEMTLTKMIDRGYLTELYDLYSLGIYRDQIRDMEGFGEKSCQKLLDSIDRSRTSRLSRFIYALGILNVGTSGAGILCRHFHNDVEKLMKADVEEMTQIAGIGPVIAGSVRDYFDNNHNKAVIEKLLACLTFPEEEDDGGDSGREGVFDLSGKTFVITGTLNHYSSRRELKDQIEKLGGKVTGSVSKNTDYLINNNMDSPSSKNKKAKELGIPIITEEGFLEMTEENKQ